MQKTTRIEECVILLNPLSQTLIRFIRNFECYSHPCYFVFIFQFLDFGSENTGLILEQFSFTINNESFGFENLFKT